MFDMSAPVMRLARHLMRHRERYLRAWFAQTGIMPADAMLEQWTEYDAERQTVVTYTRVVPRRDPRGDDMSVGDRTREW